MLIQSHCTPGFFPGVFYLIAFIMPVFFMQVAFALLLFTVQRMTEKLYGES